MSDRSITLKTIAIEPTENVNQIEVQLRYNVGGMNYFTYKDEPRGYYLSVNATKVERHDGYSTVSFSPMKGYKKFIEGASRFGQNKLLTLAKNLDMGPGSVVDKIVNQIIEEQGLTVAQEQAA